MIPIQFGIHFLVVATLQNEYKRHSLNKAKISGDVRFPLKRSDMSKKYLISEGSSLIIKIFLHNNILALQIYGALGNSNKADKQISTCFRDRGSVKTKSKYI